MRWFAAVLAAVVLIARPALALPQPISAAEKAAAEAVADYLARGPIAFYERLDPNAPLRLLDRAEALQEIEVRAGEPAGATWTMRSAGPGTAAFEISFPSGAEELLMVELKETSGSWKILGLRTLAEPFVDLSVPYQPRPAPSPPVAAAAPAQGRWRVAALAVAALLLTMVGGVIRHTMRLLSTLLLLLACCLFCAQLAVAINPRLTFSAPVQALRASRTKNLPFAELRPLLRLRRAMTRGESLPPVVADTKEVSETAKLWKAQWDATPGSEVAVTVLGEAPLVSLLRARSAADAGRREEAAGHYDAFRHRINALDAFWMEQALGSTAKATPAGDVFGPSRDAGVFYLKSMISVARGALPQARDHFRQAWRMQPMTRPEVVRAGFFAPLLHDPMISVLVNLNQPDEPRTADLELGHYPMKLPPRARVSASGTFVRVTVDAQHLDIPGGADIAPRDAEIVPATEWNRREEAEALRDFDQLCRSSLASPGARLRATRTAQALTEHNRWADVIKLTDSIRGEAETVPVPLLVERVRALLRLRRNEEARSLARSPAVGRSMQQSGADTGTLIDLAELLTQAGAYDDAIETYKRVESAKQGPDIAQRIREVDLRRSLANSAPTATTAHFEIHSMPDVPATVAERVGQLLEAELARVLSRITLSQFSRVRVNILNWTDFASQLTGSDDILGFYDGDITIPFGGVERFREQVVAILTHEMTHAVIAQASDDNAPRWFQEGLARRMELIKRHENIFQNRSLTQVPSLSVLDAQLEAGVDPYAVSDAYLESATFMRFLEDRYGPQTIDTLIAAYRTGANTDEAFLSALNRSTVDIDREFRQWGQNHSTAFIDDSPWPYAQFYSLGIDKRVLEGFHWSKKPPVKP